MQNKQFIILMKYSDEIIKLKSLGGNLKSFFLEKNINKICSYSFFCIVCKKCYDNYLKKSMTVSSRQEEAVIEENRVKKKNMQYISIKQNSNFEPPNKF